MGTNYYHVPDAPVPCCPKCSRECETCAERVHIGKSSAGWTFSFHATETIRTYADWLEALIAGGRIVDEYGRDISLPDFVAMVRRKRDDPRSHAAAYGHDSRNFLDPLGHSFNNGEFR